MNVFLILSKYLKVKQIDIQTQNEEDPNLIEELQVDPRIKEQVLDTLKNNKELFDKHILDFIEITIYSDPFSLCKKTENNHIDDKDPNVYFDLGGFTKIKEMLFNFNKSLIVVYGVCKLDYYQKESLRSIFSQKKQTQTWSNAPRSLESCD